MRLISSLFPGAVLIEMTTRTLYLGWQNKEGNNRRWFPIGRLDIESSSHRFRYIHGAERAQEETRFLPLPDFPDMNGDYRSEKLFSLFENRVMASGRPERMAYLSSLGLPKDADPVQILSVNGGTRVTDAYEVFPKIETDANGDFSCRFFLHGLRYVNQSALERLERLNPGEKLNVNLQRDNPATGLAVQILTTDGYMIGWTPCYLVDELKKALDGKSGDRETQVRVMRINPHPATSDRRALIEMCGRWNKHKLMSSRDFQPLVD